MNRRAASLWLAGLLFTAPIAADGIGKAGVIQDRIGDVARLHAAVPGSLAGVAFKNSGAGVKEIWLLVAPPGSPQADDEEPSDEENERRKELLPDCPASDRSRANRKLFRLDRDGAGALVEVRSDLPWNSAAIRFAELGGDGGEILVLTVSPVEPEPAPGDVAPGLYTWEGDPASLGSRLKPLLEEPFLVWDRKAPEAVAAPGLGDLTMYRYDQEAGRFGSVAVLPMPMDAAVRQDRITMAAQTVFPVEVAAGHVVYVTPPRPFGKTRLRSALIDPEAPDRDAMVIESWARLPEPEDLLQWDHRVLDGRPVLVVQTKTAEKLALFGEKRVRVYGLDPDRSRTGFPPLLEAESGMNLWQGGTPWILDVNRDGRSDLVIGYWKGLKNSRVVLEAFLRNEDGTFAEQPRTTAFDVEDGERSFVAYGRDLNGDGLLDLLVVADGRLRLYPGLRSRNGKKLVDTEAERILEIDEQETDREGSVTISIGTGGASAVQPTAVSIPSFMDMDGDGVEDILMVTRGTWKIPGTFTVLFLNPDQ